MLVSNHCGLLPDFENTENIFIEKFIDSSKIIQLVDIIYTHGGKNTLNELIISGKYFIGIPGQNEQLSNLKYLEEKGVCICLSPSEVKRNPDILIDSLIKIESDYSYQQSVNDIKKSLKSYSNEKLINFISENEQFNKKEDDYIDIKYEKSA